MIQETSVQFDGNFRSCIQGQILEGAFKGALALDTKLPMVVRDMEGMSGRKYRYFINKVLQLTEDPRYLEIGSWAGSTACAALYGNAAKALCIDNWSEFGGPKDVFLQNIDVIRTTAQIDFRFLESDFRTVDYADIGKFNIFLFDGPHTEEDQRQGVALTGEALDDTYIFVVDDWNWEPVRLGTFSGIKHCNIDVICSIQVRTTQDNSHPTLFGSQSDWHNGYFMAVCKKNT